jgi:hypothetical protein
LTNFAPKTLNSVRIQLGGEVKKKSFKSGFQSFLRRLNSERKFGRFWSEFWLHHIDVNAIFRLWFILPFNGQARRLYNVNSIAFMLKPSYAIETGTYYATSTFVFLGIPSVKKTFSIESNPLFFEISRERYRREIVSGQLEVILGDSKIEITKILEHINGESEVILCYLDAHWQGDIPTLYEIQALCEWGGNWVGIIDDFQVPHDDGYGYDQYSGAIVGPSLLNDKKEIVKLAPREKSTNETGARRGTAYILGGIDRESNAKLLLEELELTRLN